LAFSPDGRTLALGLSLPRIELYRAPVGEGAKPDRALEAAAAVDVLAFSPDGRRLAAGTAAPSVQLFIPDTAGDPGALHPEAGPVRPVRFSPDGASVLVASKEGLHLWSPARREALRFVLYGPDVRDAAFTPDGAGIVVADRLGELLLGKPAPAG